MYRCFVILCLLLLGGCFGQPVAPSGWLVVAGRIQPEFSWVQAVVAPATVAAGSPFTVTVNTIGSSSCTRAHKTSVQVDDLTASLTPLNWEAPAEQACTDDLGVFPHSVQVVFARPGEALLRILATDLAGAPVRFEVPLTVTPGGAAAGLAP